MTVLASMMVPVAVLVLMLMPVLAVMVVPSIALSHNGTVAGLPLSLIHI